MKVTVLQFIGMILTVLEDHSYDSTILVNYDYNNLGDICYIK